MNKWITRHEVLQLYIIAGLILAGILISASCNTARAEYVPYGGGCSTTVVIQPDGKRLICTTCQTGSGLSVTVCQ